MLGAGGGGGGGTVIGKNTPEMVAFAGLVTFAATVGVTAAGLWICSSLIKAEVVSGGSPVSVPDPGPAIRASVVGFGPPVLVAVTLTGHRV